MNLTRKPDVEVTPPAFLPEGFDPADVSQLRSAMKDLQDRPVASADELRQWVLDSSEVASYVYAEMARRLTAMNRDTRDAELQKSYLEYQRDVITAFQIEHDKLNRRYLADSSRPALMEKFGDEFVVYDRDQQTSAELYREQNVRLGAKEGELGARYQEIRGNQTVELDGETLTMQQCAARLQERDRKTREKAWRAVAERMLADADAIDDLFDELLGIRHQMALNAGFDNYRDLAFKSKRRYDYTPRDCEGYHDAVEKVVLPHARELNDQRMRLLGLPSVRPWDTEVSLFGTEPRRVFEDQAGFVAQTRQLFRAVDPFFDEQFDILVRNELLDLMSRPGKAPGGYNCMIEDMRLPFIFYNAVGLRSDLRVLLHEGGHAFHSLAVRDIPIVDYRHSPTEFAEVASMSMELFGLERLEQVWGAEEAKEVAFPHLTGMLTGLPSIAAIDAFQHWIYTHPGHDRRERAAKWNEIAERFRQGVDHEGLEKYRPHSWQRVPHLFTHPMYYIEYGIATIGALQLWRNEREDHEGAVAAYRRALALGGSRPLPELFEAAGARFAMDREILDELMPDLSRRIGELAPG